MLNFDYELVRGHTIIAVAGRGRQDCDDASIQYDEILIELDVGAIHIEPSQDTDELRVFLKRRDDLSTGVAFEQILELAGCVGRELGWCWECKNYLGYSDVFLMSFSGLQPEWAFVGLGSQIQLNRILLVTASPPSEKVDKQG